MNVVTKNQCEIGITYATLVTIITLTEFLITKKITCYQINENGRRLGELPAAR